MIILLHGPDTFRARQKLAEIVDSYQKKHKGSFNFKRCESFEDLQAELDQQALFGGKKLLLIKGALQDPQAKEKIKKKLKDFEKTEHVIVFFEESEIKGRLGAAKEQKFDFLSGQTLRNWVKKEFEKLGAKPESSAIDKLIELVGSDSWQLASEIKKLAAYKKNVDEKSVEFLVSPKIEADIFKTVDAIGAKNKKQALLLLRKHLKKGDSPLYLLTMINYQFRNLVLVKSGSKNLKMHPFVQRKSTEQARRFSFEELKKIYAKLVETDLNIKTGKLDAETALELFISEI